ncbi:hypothetical protein ROZALSC1DRAFT_30801, partial [Rozella allomycis CSF55]
LDEEDLALIEENTGINVGRGYRRVKRRVEREGRKRVGLEGLFDEEGEAEVEDVQDEMDDFIEYEEDEVNREERKAVRRQRMQELRERGRDIESMLGISKEAWLDIQEIFGDGHEYDYALIDDDIDEGEEKGVSLEKIFEPSELEDRHFTVRDEEIRLNDVPERMQTGGEIRRVEEEELEKEALWIINRMNDGMNRMESNPLFFKCVIEILRMLVIEYYEIPFIALHRKEVFSDFMVFEELWLIYDLDEQYKHLNGLKNKLKESVEKCDGWLKNVYKKAETIEQVMDVQEYLNLKVNGKKNVKRDEYLKGKENGLEKFVEKIGIKSFEIGENLMVNFKKNVVRESDVGVEQVAMELVCTAFPTVECVVDGGVRMFAIEIANDPNVRRILRDLVYKQTYVTVNPTDKGRVEIDVFHDFAPIKYLTRKPIELFKGYQFFELIVAEASRDIKIEIVVEIDDRIVKGYEEMIVSNLNDEWNEIRRKSFNVAFREYLIPLFKKQFKEELIKSSSEALGLALQTHLQTICERVLSNTAVMGVLLNENGIVLETFKWKEFNNEFKMTIDKVKPTVVCVSGMSIKTRDLFNEISKIVEDEEMKVKWHSERGKKEFENYAPLLRRLIDPLMETCGFLTLHPWQNHLNQQLILKYLNRAMINIVNLVGVDINKIIEFEHLQFCLQFVSGLGKRKAFHLISQIKKQGFLDQRASLISKELMGKCVFMNCASFIRIQEKYIPRRVSLDCLDNTRIHPENYYLARKMAADALDVDENLNDDSSPFQHCQDIMANPELLDSLMLDEFAKELEASKNIKKLITLFDIKDELSKPYIERRNPFKDPEIDSIFTMLTGETSLSLQSGMIIPATISKIYDRYVTCRFESGILGIIPINHLADMRVDNPFNIVKPNQSVRCKIVSINKERFSLELSMKPSDLDRLDSNIAIEYDPFYSFSRERDERDHNGMSSLIILLDELTEPGKNALQTRFISHPLFMNISRDSALNFLKQKDLGELVIRPSSKRNHLAITWKVFNDIYCDILVREEEKESDLALGKALFIDKQKYDDLDELLTRHLQPMIDLVFELVNHPKFSDASLDSVKTIVAEEKRADPKRIPYKLVASSEYPGKFVIVFVPGSNPHFEYVTVTPNGIRLRSRFFGNVDDMINWFKRHYKELMTRK